MDRICFALIACLLAGLRMAAQSGSFSPEQVKHGERLFLDKCGACHGNNLEGGPEAPPLRDDAFWDEWDQKPARALYSRVISTMPPDSPGSLPEKAVIDIVAFLVHSNGVPSGTQTIESPNDLNNIKLQKPK